MLSFPHIEMGLSPILLCTTVSSSLYTAQHSFNSFHLHHTVSFILNIHCALTLWLCALLYYVPLPWEFCGSPFVPSISSILSTLVFCVLPPNYPHWSFCTYHVNHTDYSYQCSHSFIVAFNPSMPTNSVLGAVCIKTKKYCSWLPSQHCFKTYHFPVYFVQ